MTRSPSPQPFPQGEGVHLPREAGVCSPSGGSAEPAAVALRVMRADKERSLRAMRCLLRLYEKNRDGSAAECPNAAAELRSAVAVHRTPRRQARSAEAVYASTATASSSATAVYPSTTGVPQSAAAVYVSAATVSAGTASVK